MTPSDSTLPQLGAQLFLTDGGIETSLIFNEGLELPDFAAFILLKDKEGREALRSYFRAYADVSRRHDTGLVLETPTWRASSDWGRRLGYDSRELLKANREAAKLVAEVAGELAAPTRRVVISGCIGPRGDGYVPDCAMNELQAREYHQPQVDAFREAAVDLVTGITMNYVEEAIGIVHAARQARLPVVVSFTVETDGRLPTGQSLAAAIMQVDQVTNSYASYFMLNCAHPTHFAHLFASTEPWMQRLRGLRANASMKSHSELNESTELDIGNPAELGSDYVQLVRQLPQLNILGGCCGTDQRHVEQIAAQCRPLFSS